MKHQEQIHEYVLCHADEIVDTLAGLVRIPSVRGEEAPGAPFGRACAEVLEHARQLYAENGFDTELDADGGYLLSYFGQGDKTLGLFAHADVVPVHGAWTVTAPFEPTEKDGFLFGRGAMDDKSAMVISLYCAKMLKELKLPFSSRLICFTGSNEESGMRDIEKYVKKHRPPAFSLVCDTGFPLFRGDKGILRFVATQKEPMRQLTDFYGGEAFNIVLGEASATIGARCLTKKGVSRHGALPEGSINAAFLLARDLSQSELLCAHDRTQMDFIANVLERYYGEVYGIESTDKDFGRLTVTNGIVSMREGRIGLGFDMRYGASVDIERAKEKIDRFFEGNGWGVEFVYESKPFAVSESDPHIMACLDAYKCFMGEREAATYINAGGTYAKHLPCAAEIGVSLGGTARTFDLPEGHGGVHQPDECISIDGLLNAIELTMQMLLACDDAEK